VSRTGHRAYRRMRARLLRTTDTCHYCGIYLDPELVHPHPQSATADHVHPIKDGGHNLGKLVAACFSCNLARNRKHPREQPTRHARNW
jgi:5-methylcytosine-specific restriction endonuclease McrA